MYIELWGKNRFCYLGIKKSWPEPKKIDDASPPDVHRRAKDRIEYLKCSIESSKKSIADDEHELAKWQKILLGA